MRTATKWALGILVGIAVLLFLFVMPLSYLSPPEPIPLPAPAQQCETCIEVDPMPLPAPLPPPPLDALAEVDRILGRMQLGNIAFNTPKSMNLYDTVVIQLLLGVETSIEELKRLVEAEGEKAGASIPISNRMEARLSGPDFAITAITPETQAVSRTEVTDWKWEIEPKRTGRQFLHLTLSAILSVGGDATPRTIRTFDNVIEVEVTWNQKVTRFVENNWQWLWAAILVPIAGWLGKGKRRGLTGVVIKVINNKSLLVPGNPRPWNCVKAREIGCCYPTNVGCAVRARKKGYAR